MATIKDFKELNVWKLANRLATEIYAVIKSTSLKNDFELRNQIDRSSGSIADNIAEGFDREGNREFIQYLSIAKGSCAEVRSQLERLKDREYINQNEFENIDSLCVEISKKISSFMSYLKNSDFKGNKFHEPNSEYQTKSEHQTSNTKPTPNPEPQTPNFYAHSTAVIDENCNIGNGTKIWHFSHVMSNCTLGENCNLGQNVVVSPDVVLGKNVKVQNNVSIYTGVICEDDVFLGPSMVFTNVINPRSAVNRRGEYAVTHVRKGASIGANATIVCGNEIGQFALIGAGAVVTKPIKPYALVVGNPSKQIGWVSEYGHRLNFEDKGFAICEESKQEYKLENENVTRIS